MAKQQTLEAAAEVVPQEPRSNGAVALANLGPSPVFALLDRAVGQLGGEGANDVAQAIETLVRLQREEIDREARRDFLEAFNAFQSECPQIPKDRESVQTTRGGGTRTMKYSALDGVDKIVKPLLIKNGFSFSWSSKPSEGGKLAITCHLGHRSGHEREHTAIVSPDKSAPMNDSQRDGSTMSYGERYSLLMALGLATTEDTNGAPRGDMAPIEEDQIATIEHLLQETGRSREKMLAFLKVERIEDITQQDYERVLSMLRRAR